MIEQLNRSVGRLEASLEHVSSDVSEMRKELKTLNQFYWRMSGGSAVIAFLITGLIEVVHLMKGK